MRFFNFDVPPKRTNPEPQDVVPSTETLVQQAQETVEFVGKRNADAQSLATFQSAKSDTAAFLEGIGQPEAAKRVRALASKGGMFYFSELTVKRSSNKTDTEKPGGMYSWEQGAVAIAEWLLKRDGQDGVRATVVHELIHHASFIGDARTVHPVVFDDTTLLRRQGGFDIMTALPEFANDDDKNKSRFNAFNEGFTDTLARMIDPYGWQNPHPYDENRYLVQLVLRALTNAMQEKGPATLRDSWLLLSNAYFNNDFSFGKKIDELLGPGTLRSIAKFNFVSPAKAKENSGKGRENPEADAAFLERLAAKAGLPFNRADYDVLVNEGPVSRLRATLKSMEDELRRAALSPISMKKAA